MKSLLTFAALGASWTLGASHAAAQVKCVATNTADMRLCTGVVNKLVSRKFLLYVPPAARVGTSAKPLLVDFHGMGSSAEAQTTRSCWKDFAASHGAVVAYPDGSGFPNSFGAGTCCGVAPVGGRDDVQLAKDIVAATKTILAADSVKVRIDPARTYATGWSNGGKLAHHLACNAPAVFRGAGAMSQSYSLSSTGSCAGTVPVIEFRGTSDSIVPYALDLPTSWSAEESMAHWATDMNCRQSTEYEGLEAEEFSAVPRAPAGEAYAYCLKYQGCQAGLAQCTLQAGHDVYANSDNAQLCETTWRFWQEHPAP